MADVLVLAEATDTLALRVAAALGRRGVPTLALAPVELSLGCRWVYSSHAPGTAPELHVRGQSVADGDIRAVFNRLAAPRFFPSGLWTRSVDADYAEMEFAALVVSWLGDLPVLVIGRPSTGVLWAERRTFEWLALAAAAGLPVRHVRASTDARVLDSRGRAAYDPTDPGGVLLPIDSRVAGGNPIVAAERVTHCRRTFLVQDAVIDAPDDRLIPGVRQLGRLAEADVLECHFARAGDTNGPWVFCGATTFPTDAPGLVVDALAGTLARAEGTQS